MGYKNYYNEHTPNHDVVNATVQQYTQQKKQYDVVHIGNISPGNRLTESEQDMQNYFNDFFQHAKQLVSPNGQMLVGIANINPEYIMSGNLNLRVLLKKNFKTVEFKSSNSITDNQIYDTKTPIFADKSIGGQIGYYICKSPK